MSSSLPSEPIENIAIIGMSGRFPGARTLDRFWQNLRDGVEAVSFFSDEELLSAGVDSALFNDPNFVKAGGVLEDVDLFDAVFFGFSARDAEILDPQQRLFLECASVSLEDAGYNPETYPGMIGVFAGTSMSTYLYNIYAQIASLGFIDNFQLMVGNDKDYLTTLVSYKLNLKGPSVAIQTACSTSLVAVGMACQSLLSYQCDMALAGGSTVSVPQRKGYYYQPGGILSSDGYCRTFDAAAQGTVGGNGVGIVVLKRLSEALADGDHIYAVIKGSAINNDGSLKVGFTAPSVEGQAQVIAMAHAAAGIDPETINYMEAHGTATPLGDPIEVAALTQAFGLQTDKKNFCAIGSVKSNVGHLDSAAGIAGLIKTVLALQNKMIPASLHFNQPNAEIDFENSPFYVNNRLSEWKSNGGPRRAGVSSFGIGGTNAHVVLEEAPDSKPPAPALTGPLLVLSAKTSAALETATDKLASYLEQHPDLNVADVAYTYQVGRRAFKHRRMLVCHEMDAAEAAKALENREPKRILTAVQEFSERPVLYMFPGQGTQYVDMGADLYETQPTFREHVDYCSALLIPQLGFDLREVLYPKDEFYDEAKQLIGRTAVTQPALFTIEYALARLWVEWGVHPQAMIGHSIGEYVAACLAGVFTIEEALALVAQRGRLMESMPSGSMLAVPLPEAKVAALLNGNLSLAAVNAPGQCVISGPDSAIDEMSAQLRGRGLYSQVLHTSHAFHSSMMDPAVSQFVDYVRAINLKTPAIAFLSNVSGTWITPEEATDPNYWGSQMRQTVRFADGLKELLIYPEAILLEVGPGQTLGSLAKLQSENASQQLTLATLHAVQEPQADVPFLMNSAGQLWLAGVNIDWTKVHAHERRLRLSLPTYPFEYQRYWVGPSEKALSSGALADSTTRDIENWLYTPTWTPSVPTDSSRKQASPRSHWLVFHNGGELGEKLLERLKVSQQKITTVFADQQFAKLDPHTFSVRADERADYETLLNEIHEQGSPDAIVHLWNVTANDSIPEVDAFEYHQSRGFYSLLNLSQALTKLNLTGEIPIAMVSNQLQLVLGDEALSPAKATVIGACKVIPQEYPALRCRSIDIPFGDDQDQPTEWLADRLIADLTVERFSSAVAYRKGLRWVQGFERLRATEPNEITPTLRERGVYLITGGLGNIGLTLAEHLASTVKAKLVLVGRSAFPDSSEWDQWLATHGEDDVTRKIRRLLKLEELGAEVMVASADASDLEQMRSVIERATKRFGEINGVVHGAGNVSSGSVTAINRTDRIASDLHFKPKVKGLFVLEELLRGRKADFCLMLSSLSSILGGLGFVAYSAANNFMDAFANQQNQAKSMPWISVNWDGWQFLEDASNQAASFSSDLILPQEGQAAFQRILDSPKKQVVVSVTDLQTRIDQWVNLNSISTAPQGQAESQTHSHPRPNLSSEYVAASTPAEETIVEIWQQLLGVKPIGVHDNFFELGGHSLLAIQIISRIRNTFQIELPVQQLFETPTVVQIAESIERERVDPQREDDDLAEVLSLVEGLAEDEVKKFLARHESQQREISDV